MKKIFYFITALLFVSCTSNEDIDISTTESNEIPEDTINMYAGYGNPVSNTIGTLGLMSACSPWMFFNCPSYMFCPPPMGFWGSMGMGFGGFGMMPFGGSVSITTTTRRGFYC